MMGKEMYKLTNPAQKAVLSIANGAFSVNGLHIPRSVPGTAAAPAEQPKPGK